MKKNVILPALRITSETKARLDKAISKLDEETRAVITIPKFREIAIERLSQSILSNELKSYEVLLR